MSQKEIMEIIQCYKEGIKYLYLSTIERVRKIKMLDRYHYARTLIDENKNHSILNIEHDIEVTKKNIDEIEKCQEPLCVFSYFVYPFSTGRSIPFIVHRIKNKDKFDFIDENYKMKYVDYAGFGFIKFKKGLLNNLHLTETQLDWKTFDSIISKKFYDKNIKFHFHPTILIHHHKQ